MTELISNWDKFATPLGLAVILALIIYQMVKNQAPASQASVDKIANNHLHSLPEMADTLKRIEEKLDKINDNITYVKARINGKSH